MPTTLNSGVYFFNETIEMPIDMAIGDNFSIPKENNSDNWLNKRIRDLYRLPPVPKVDPKFVESFVSANKLVFANPEFPFKDPKAHIGIEVEVENVSYINPNIPLCFWQITVDGSLRNHGKEFKTFAIPIKNAQLALEQLFQGLNPDIDFSPRTSIHVHLDVHGTTMNQVLSLLFTYAAVENLLFKFAGSNRRNSIFCSPITETRLFHDLDITDAKKLRTHFEYVWQKYSALNLMPINTFGTVEFRQMPGTRDITKLCIWIDMLSRIRLYAYKNTLEDIIKTISNLNTNSQYRKFIDSIFENLTPYLDTTNLSNDMEKSVYICKNCVGVNTFHRRVMELTDKTSSLLKKIIVKDIVVDILTPKLYEQFQLLKHTGGHRSTNEALYRGIQRQGPDYLRAFPNQKELILFIVKHPI